MAKPLKHKQVEPDAWAVEDVPAHWASVESAFPYVSSIRAKIHRVAVGYPENTRRWRTDCGCQFGISKGQRAVLSLPACHKTICDRCFKAEKEVAKTEAEVRVREVGADAH